MIHRTKVVLPIVSVLFVSGALGVTLAMQDDERPLPAEAGDLAQAAAIEVRDASGQVVLNGSFDAGETEDDGEVERQPRQGGAKVGEVIPLGPTSSRRRPS